MELDERKIDEATLALLYLGLHDGVRAWKGFDWDAMNRLFEAGCIDDPRSKAKSVVFTAEGLERAKRLLEENFCEPPLPHTAPVKKSNRNWPKPGNAAAAGPDS